MITGLVTLVVIALIAATLRMLNTMDYTETHDLVYFFFMDFGIIVGFVLLLPLIVVVSVVYYIGNQLCA